MEQAKHCRPAATEAKLKELSSKAHSNLYERLVLAEYLLSDDEWLAGYASLYKAEAYMADCYFSELRGLVDFGKLIAIFRKFEAETWDEYRYDIAAMESLYDESVQPNRAEKVARPRGSYKKQAEQLANDLAEAKAQLKTVRDVVDQREKEARDFVQRVRELERENAELRGRIAELERFANLQAVA